MISRLLHLTNNTDGFIKEFKLSYPFLFHKHQSGYLNFFEKLTFISEDTYINFSDYLSLACSRQNTDLVKFLLSSTNFVKPIIKAKFLNNTFYELIQKNSIECGEIIFESITNINKVKLPKQSIDLLFQKGTVDIFNLFTSNESFSQHNQILSASNIYTACSYNNFNIVISWLNNFKDKIQIDEKELISNMYKTQILDPFYLELHDDSKLNENLKNKEKLFRIIFEKLDINYENIKTCKCLENKDEYTAFLNKLIKSIYMEKKLSSIPVVIEPIKKNKV